MTHASNGTGPAVPLQLCGRRGFTFVKLGDGSRRSPIQGRGAEGLGVPLPSGPDFLTPEPSVDQITPPAAPWCQVARSDGEGWLMRVIRGVLGTLLATAVLIVLSAPQGVAQLPNSLTVKKVVAGPVPPGTTFEVEVTCENEKTGTTTKTARFDTEGNPTNENSFAPGEDNCTVTETATGGAQNVSYSCTDDFALADLCEAPGPQPDPMKVAYTSPGNQNVTVTVTNTFTPPPPPPLAPGPPPPPVVVQPVFTG
jgi:hypothetical protein